ncbi:MAG: beta-galactosidase [Candidatus Hydrogenedentes bacterium]|nr:beta-galactosidase [Candidatus Hydrogenedentota bacterium]
MVAILTLTLHLLGAQPVPPVVAVKDFHGAATLFINGKPQSAMSYMTYTPIAHNFKTMGDAGVHLYSFSATPTDSTYELAPLCWKGSGEFDYANLDERAHLLLSNDPKALFFPRVYLGTPPWWADANPDDLVQVAAPDGTIKVLSGIEYAPKDKRVAAWASERWRQDTADALRKFIQHVEHSDYADRVIGYHLTSGTTEEWMQWGSNEDLWADYSPVNLARFREWLKTKYRNDAALRVAWNDAAVTFLSAAIPLRPARAASERGFLRDPKQAQNCIDYALYTSWLVSDTMRFFARTVKDETAGKRIVGVYYGYVLQLAGGQRDQNAGHLALREVFSCPDIDFISSPSSYMFRELGTGFPHTMSLVDSAKQHGKLWFDENDYRTWLTPGVKAGEFGKTATYEESLLVQQREFAWVLANRLGMWWFDMGGGWYDDPRMLGEIGKMQRIADGCVGVNGAPTAEIAFVVDGKSTAYTKLGNAYGWEALIKQLPQLARIGAPFDLILVSDLDRARKYKLYIFPNCFAPTDVERRIIKAKVQRRGAVVVWIGPAGIYRNGQLDTAAMEELTGVHLELAPDAALSHAVPLPNAAQWGWRNPAAYGPNINMETAAFSVDSKSQTLAWLEGTKRPALTAKDNGGRLTLHSAVPTLPTELLRSIAEKAGVHLYVDSRDIVWASHDLLAVSVNAGGPRTVHLPRRCTVTDLWTDQKVANNTRQFEVNIPDKGTALFRLR